MRTTSRTVAGVATALLLGAALVGVTVVTRDSDEPAVAEPSRSSRTGTLERVTYDSANGPLGDDPAEKNAMVYLPPGYDDGDTERRYDVVYLMHGAGGDEHSWLGRPSDPSGLPDQLDRMITDGLIAPTIVVAPTFDTGIDTIGRNADAFYDELVEDLLPRIEGSYRSYADGVAAADLAAVRDHRVFGGFSMGGVTTWHVFVRGLDYFAGFLPMSADSWIRGPYGGRDEPDATAGALADAVAGSGLSSEEFSVFAATGTDDWARGPMTRQIEAMTARTETFDAGEGGNLTYHLAEGRAHDYDAAHAYVLMGLPQLLGRDDRR